MMGLGWLGSKLLGYGLGALALLGTVLGFMAKFRSEGRAQERAAQEAEELRRMQERKRTDAEVGKIPETELDRELDRDGWLRPPK